MFPKTILRVVLTALLSAAPLHAAIMERVTLASGFELDCTHRETLDTGRVRLFTSDRNYVEVDAAAIRAISKVDIPTAPPVAANAVMNHPTSAAKSPEIGQILKSAETKHNVDLDLLASVIRAESGGRTRAVSHAGAQGLMQLMPATAKGLGVTDTFAPEQNVDGGSAYLDQLLTRYHDNVQLALAAYNAGPAAVDKYHGVPPYRETRAYIARVINEFNRLKRTQQHATIAASHGE